MKKSIYKYLFLTSIILIGGMYVHAQQKASDRPFSSELKKVKEIQETRNKMLRETKQPSDRKETQATTNPVNKPKQRPATKPSILPMSLPPRSKKQ
jgi:hypothetical protein